jgi:hypothetical protein
MIVKRYYCPRVGGQCWGCDHADDCTEWLDVEPYEPVIIETDEDEVFMSLVSGENIAQACDGSVFYNIEDPTDLEKLEQIGLERLRDQGIQKLNLYVTGLSTALVTAINICKKLQIELVLYHFDKSNKGYFPQKVE